MMEEKIWHERGSLTEFLLEYEEGSPVAALNAWQLVLDRR